MAQRNADIRSFFSSQARTPCTPASSTPAPPAPPAAPALPAERAPPPEPSSPPPLLHDGVSVASSPPSIAPRRTYDRDAVIAASDDDASDDDDDGLGSSDSELPDLMARPARWKPGAENGGGGGGGDKVAATPRPAKRAVTAVHHQGVLFNSPLSIRKKHKYDLTAIARLNERDQAAQAGEERVRRLELVASGKGEKATDSDSGEDGYEVNRGEDCDRMMVSELQNQLVDTAPAEGADEEVERAKRARLARALARAALRSTGKKTFYFFEQTEQVTGASVMGNAFPVAHAKGPWKIFADKQDRARHFQSGLPYDIQAMFGNLPDEIFLWILHELCQERRRDLAGEYAKLLRACNEKVSRLVTHTLLQQLFQDLGATKQVFNLHAAVVMTEELKDPYQKRSWTCLENFLAFLGSIANHLRPVARSTAMQILLRLGMDKAAVENFGLAQEWRWAVDLVARSVPRSDWPSFCQAVCTSLYQSTEKATLRYRAITLLGPVQRPESPPNLQRRTLDLKRRLAAVFFFDEPSRADKEPEGTVSIRAIIDRLDDPPFIFHSKEPATDFHELAALMLLLNIALGDAARQTTVAAPGSARDFDSEVDELAASMKAMGSRVNVMGGDGIGVSRMEVKNAVEVVHDRLLFQVRTRRAPKKIGITSGEVEDPYLPQQQSFMASFLKKRAGRARPSVETEEMSV